MITPLSGYDPIEVLDKLNEVIKVMNKMAPAEQVAENLQAAVVPSKPEMPPVKKLREDEEAPRSRVSVDLPKVKPHIKDRSQKRTEPEENAGVPQNNVEAALNVAVAKLQELGEDQTVQRIKKMWRRK